MVGGAHAYAAAVLRPLAEQLAGLAGSGSGAAVLDVAAGGGELTRVLAPLVAPARLVALETGEATAAALREELRAAQVDAAVTASPLHALPFVDGRFDLAVSLLRLSASHGGEAALAEMRRVARRGVVLVWDGGATVENALLAAWQDLAGETPATGRVAAGEPPPAPRGLAAALEPPPAPGWTRREVSDVARFDSVAQMVGALVARYSLSVGPDVVAALVRRLEQPLAALTAADGTLRIPVRATALRFG